MLTAPNLAWDEIRKNDDLVGRFAVVTGASGGVGRAIALALARQGVQLCAIGRNPAALAETTEAVRQFSQATDFQMDFTINHDFQPLVQLLQEKAAGLDMLIHCAGIVHQDPMECARIEDFDRQYAINVRAPYIMTQQLLSFLARARGQIVFINSSLGLTAKRPEVGQYSATKHALKAIADSLREEVNHRGIRVLSVYLGRTATHMQEALCREQGRPFNPEALLQPEDVASVVLHALMLPSTAEVTDISMRPMQK